MTTVLIYIVLLGLGLWLEPCVQLLPLCSIAEQNPSAFAAGKLYLAARTVLHAVISYYRPCRAAEAAVHLQYAQGKGAVSSSSE